MNADWNDAPSRIQHKAGSAIVWCVSLVFGLAITGGGLYLASGQMKPNPRAEAQVAHLNAEAIRKHNEEVRARQRASLQRYSPAPMEEKNWIRSSEAQSTDQVSRELGVWANQRAQETHERLTSFNDGNYKPKQPANTYSPPARQIASSQTSDRSTSRSMTRERDGEWIDKWSGGARYYAEWEAVNNHIESSSVCANHKRGSIDYRECRKGAKQYFKEQCKAWNARYQSDRKDWSEQMKQRYCAAGSSFNPMG